VPVKKFASRQTAIDRIWKAIQKLAPCSPEETDRLPAESGTTSARAGTKGTQQQSQPARPCVLAEWTISTGVDTLQLAGHVRLTPAPKLGGPAGKQLRRRPVESNVLALRASADSSRLKKELEGASLQAGRARFPERTRGARPVSAGTAANTNQAAGQRVDLGIWTVRS